MQSVCKYDENISNLINVIVQSNLPETALDMPFLANLLRLKARTSLNLENRQAGLPLYS